MKKIYETTVRGTVSHTVRIEAESEEEAETKLHDALWEDNKGDTVYVNDWETFDGDYEWEEIDEQYEEEQRAYAICTKNIADKIGWDEWCKRQKKFKQDYDKLIRHYSSGLYDFMEM